VVVAVLTIAVVVIAFRARTVWRANAYRRAALRELQSSTTVAEIAEILKRAALVVYPRTDIAALSGSAWCQWLGKTGAGHVPDEVAEALTRGVFGKVDVTNVSEVRTFAANWIQYHDSLTEDRKGNEEPRT
jgi:hypothetical protein